MLATRLEWHRDPLQGPSKKDGMPGEDEISLLNRMEDLICDYLGAKHTGVLCLVLTTQGMRESIIYLATEGGAELTGAFICALPEVRHPALCRAG